MRIAYNIVLSFAAVLNHIGIISPFDCLPNGDPLPVAPRSGTGHSPESLVLPAGYVLPARMNFSSDRTRSPSANSESLHAGTRSIREISPPFRLLHLPFDQLKFIRLVPHANPNQRFEVRRYTFPCDKALHLRKKYNSVPPFPSEEQTVLSTSNGDVLAILEGDSFLRGIFTTKYNIQRRAKINMNSGKVTELTAEEIQETPLASNSRITKNFRLLRTD